MYTIFSSKKQELRFGFFIRNVKILAVDNKSY